MIACRPFLILKYFSVATAGFPFATAAAWLTWFQQRAVAYAKAYKYEHKGRAPPTQLDHKDINTMAISTSSKIQGDFKKAKKNVCTMVFTKFVADARFLS